jgi:chromate reductase, NAD(P)H dehydrogenase (quinone)
MATGCASARRNILTATMSDLHLLLVSGSTRRGSTNSSALRTVQALAPVGTTASLFEELAELPPFNPDDDHDPVPPPVAALRHSIADADAVLFCTPEYAGTLPGSFKNLLDWTVGGGEIYRKPVAWINVAASGRGLGADATIRIVLGYVGAEVIEAACVSVPVSRDDAGADGVVQDSAIRARLADVISTIGRHVGDAG